jgi:hypothetical protein
MLAAIFTLNLRLQAWKAAEIAIAKRGHEDISHYCKVPDG